MSVIFIAMMFKVITAKDIIYENGKIEKIEGIAFEKKQIILERNIYGTDSSTFAPQITIDKKIMSDSWEKYLKEFRKLEVD